MKALLRWVAPVTASHEQKRRRFAAFRREMLNYLDWTHSVRDWRWLTHSWTDYVLEESCVLFPCTSNTSISSSASFLLSFSSAKRWILPEKKLARKYSGQHALPKRNAACTSHLRANLILSLWKNWGLSGHQLGNSWIGEWSQRRRKTAQLYSQAMQAGFTCTTIQEQFATDTLKAPSHGLSVLTATNQEQHSSGWEQSRSVTMLVRMSRKNTLPCATRLPQPRVTWLSHLSPPTSELKAPTALLHCWWTLKVQARQLSTAEHRHMVRTGMDEIATCKSLKEAICTTSSLAKSPVLPQYHLKDVLWKQIPGLCPNFPIGTARVTHGDGSTLNPRHQHQSRDKAPWKNRIWNLGWGKKTRGQWYEPLEIPTHSPLKGHSEAASPRAVATSLVSSQSLQAADPHVHPGWEPAASQQVQLIGLTEILTRAKLNPLDTNTTPKQFPLFTTNFYILSPHAISVKPSFLTTLVILFYTRQESFRHFSDVCQGHLFLPSQPSLHVKLQISFKCCPNTLLSREQPALLALRGVNP